MRSIALGTIVLVAGSASADITGGYFVNYEVSTEDFGGVPIDVFVSDFYLSSDDGADVALNVYNLSLGPNAPTSFFQSATSTGWLAQNAGGIFDNPALRLADSFVTMGGVAQNTLLPEQAPGAGAGTGLDPNFGGNNAPAPASLAGWYNGSPPNLNGQVGQVARPDSSFGLGVMVARFASLTAFDLNGTSFEVTWNQGLGTPGVQGSFTIVPVPGALGLLGIAGLTSRRRRR